MLYTLAFIAMPAQTSEPMKTLLIRMDEDEYVFFVKDKRKRTEQLGRMDMSWLEYLKLLSSPKVK